MMKLVASTGIGATLLSALSPQKAAAITGDDTPDMHTAEVTNVLNTGNIIEPAVSQSSSLGWYVPESGDEGDYWEHEFSITTTSIGWNRRSSDGSCEGKTNNITSQHWELDMSGTSKSGSGEDFTHYTKNDEKYCGFYPHPDNSLEGGMQAVEILVDAAVGVKNPAIGGLLLIDDVLDALRKDANQGLENIANGFAFDNRFDNYQDKVYQTHRIVIEVPYDVGIDDEVEVTTWTGGEIGTETTYTLNFTAYEDTAPFEPNSVEPTTLDPEKMTDSQKEEYGVKEVDKTQTESISIDESGDTSGTDSTKYVATNLPMNVETDSKKLN